MALRHKCCVQPMRETVLLVGTPCGWAAVQVIQIKISSWDDSCGNGVSNGLERGPKVS